MIRPHDLAIYPLPFIRRAAPSDIETIVAIENESFIDPWESSVFFDAFSYFATTFFVAVCDGTVAGFIVGGLENTGENLYGHLCNFGVSSAYRRRGIGRLLVRRLEHQFALELATGVQLEVRMGNTTAQTFLPPAWLPGHLSNRRVLFQWGRCPRDDEVVQVLTTPELLMSPGKMLCSNGTEQ